jgi:hypothetical protein
VGRSEYAPPRNRNFGIHAKMPQSGGRLAPSRASPLPLAASLPLARGSSPLRRPASPSMAASGFLAGVHARSPSARQVRRAARLGRDSAAGKPAKSCRAGVPARVFGRCAVAADNAERRDGKSKNSTHTVADFSLRSHAAGLRPGWLTASGPLAALAEGWLTASGTRIKTTTDSRKTQQQRRNTRNKKR